MELSYETVRAILERYNESQHVMEWCAEYGERGYSHNHDATTPVVVLGDYWCRCDKIDDGKLHDIMQHHPRMWRQLEAQGVQCEWYDEWWIDYETGKAWRTQPDSYSWQSSIQWDEGRGDYLTPDHDIVDWIEWATADPVRRCIPHVVWSTGDIMMQGFESYNGKYESGWSTGPDDKPADIVETIKRWHGDKVEILFYLDDTRQFDITFTAWVRQTNDEDNDDMEDEDS